MKNNTCVQCGESESTIRKKGLICGVMGGGESPELEYEYPQHRFKPYSKQELKIKEKEDSDFFGEGMAEWYDETIKCRCGWKGERNTLKFEEKSESDEPFLCPNCNQYYYLINKK